MREKNGRATPGGEKISRDFFFLHGLFAVFLDGRRSGLMVSALNSVSERSGFEGALCCVLGQDTLLSQFLSPPRCINGYW